MKKVRVQSCQHIQRQTRKKRQSPKTPRKKFENGGPPPLPYSGGKERSFSPPKMRGAERPAPILMFSAAAGAAGPPRVEGRGAQGVVSPKPQPTSQNPVFSSFQTLLIILAPAYSVADSPERVQKHQHKRLLIHNPLHRNQFSRFRPS